MIRLAANLSFLFNEMPFMDRFAAAGACGFKGVEYLFPYEHSPKDIAEALDDARVAQVLFNVGPGDWSAGERGIAALPGRERDFLEALDQGLEYAAVLRCPRLHVMAGLRPSGASLEEIERVYEANLRLAATRCAQRKVEVVIEPINHRDIPGYYLNTTRQAIAVIDRIAAPNLKLQLDLYHCQVTEGDLVHHIRALAGRFSHVQIAGNPDRNEPDTGEVNYTYVLEELDASGYDGWVGCEYRPKSGTREGLEWARAYGILK